MPATSKSQQRLMAAAEHGATFPKAKALRKSMTHEQLHDFAATKLGGLPARRHITKSDREMRDRSTRGSGPMHHPDFARGYRRLG